MSITSRLFGLSIALAACSGDALNTDTSPTAAGITTAGATTPDVVTMGNTSTGTETMGDAGSVGGTMDTPTTDIDGDTASATGATDPGGICGDSIQGATEGCDDGNTDDGDGCSADCTVEAVSNCGNGLLEADELCDGEIFRGSAECKDIDPQYSAGLLTCNSCQLDFSGCDGCEAPDKLMPCDAAQYIKGDTDDILHAMELGCNTADAVFSDPSRHVPVADYMPLNVASGSWRVITQFGTYLDPQDENLPIWRPRKGDRMLIISSGKLPQPDEMGVLTQPGGTISGTNGNSDGLEDLPGLIHWQRGSNSGAGGAPFMDCDGVNDCSDALEAQWKLGDQTANDALYFQLDVTVPKGTFGYVVDFAYFSSEYPVYVGKLFNDMAILWQVSEDYTGNVTFITDMNNNPQPLSVTALAQNSLVKYRGDKDPQDPQLGGTGFQDNGGTGWASVKGPARPLETITLAWTVLDIGDVLLDTALLIDNWRWDCAGCVPNEVNSCGIQPQ